MGLSLDIVWLKPYMQPARLKRGTLFTCGKKWMIELDQYKLDEFAGEILGTFLRIWEFFGECFRKISQFC